MMEKAQVWSETFNIEHYSHCVFSILSDSFFSLPIAFEVRGMEKDL